MQAAARPDLYLNSESMEHLLPPEYSADDVVCSEDYSLATIGKLVSSISYYRAVKPQKGFKPGLAKWLFENINISKISPEVGFRGRLYGEWKGEPNGPPCLIRGYRIWGETLYLHA